jgi:hypothetical protein
LRELDVRFGLCEPWIDVILAQLHAHGEQPLRLRVPKTGQQFEHSGFPNHGVQFLLERLGKSWQQLFRLRIHKNGEQHVDSGLHAPGLVPVFARVRKNSRDEHLRVDEVGKFPFGARLLQSGLQPESTKLWPMGFFDFRVRPNAAWVLSFVAGLLLRRKFTFGAILQSVGQQHEFVWIDNTWV